MRKAVYLPRTLEKSVTAAAKQFPAVVVTGPRQSGKTTLLLHLFGMGYRYVSLDDIHPRRMASDDPRLFFDEYPPPVIIDEIQHVPSVLNHIKALVDKKRGAKGQFLLTGSQVFGLMQGVTESLAGRAAILQLFSMSLSERCVRSKLSHDPVSIYRDILRGGFPQLVVEKGLDQEIWFASYVQSYLERDIRALSQVGDLAGFERFLFAAASRAGALINYSDLARDLGVAVNTIKHWFSILEAAGQVYLLRPYHRNLGKRVVKRPKLYFLDTGLLCHLIGLSDPRHALRGPMGGALLENAVFNELHRYFVHRGRRPPVYFFQAAKGPEVDFVVEWEGKLFPMEVKLKSTPQPADASGLLKFKGIFGKEVGPGKVICLSEEDVPLTRDVRAISYLSFAERNASILDL